MCMVFVIRSVNGIFCNVYFMLFLDWLLLCNCELGIVGLGRCNVKCMIVVKKMMIGRIVFCYMEKCVMVWCLWIFSGWFFFICVWVWVVWNVWLGIWWRCGFLLVGVGGFGMWCWWWVWVVVSWLVLVLVFWWWYCCEWCKVVGLGCWVWWVLLCGLFVFCLYWVCFWLWLIVFLYYGGNVVCMDCLWGCRWVVGDCLVCWVLLVCCVLLDIWVMWLVCVVFWWVCVWWCLNLFCVCVCGLLCWCWFWWNLGNGL